MVFLCMRQMDSQEGRKESFYKWKLFDVFATFMIYLIYLDHLI